MVYSNYVCQTENAVLSLYERKLLQYRQSLMKDTRQQSRCLHNSVDATYVVTGMILCVPGSG